MKVERRDREDGVWRECADNAGTIERLAHSNNVSPEAVTTALESGEQLSTGFADYRNRMQDKTHMV